MRKILMIAGILVGLTSIACSEGKLPTSAGNYGSYSSDGTGSDTDSERNTGSVGNGQVTVVGGGAVGDSTWQY